MNFPALNLNIANTLLQNSYLKMFKDIPGSKGTGLSKAEQDDKGLSSLTAKNSAAKHTLTSISVSGKKINELYTNFKKTGNETALTGFKNYLKSSASDFSGSALNNFANLGEAAFKKKDSGFFTTMLSDYQKLNDSKKSGLGKSMMDEAGATFSALGLSSAKKFASTADYILNVKESKKDGVMTKGSDVLGDFMSKWKEIRTSGMKEPDKELKLNELSEGVAKKKNASEISDFIKEFKTKTTSV